MGDKYRVLLVEDDYIWRKHVFDVVDDRYDVHTVSRLSDAIAQYLEAKAGTVPPWDLIILDLRLEDSPLPGEDDLATFRKLLIHNDDTPIFITPGLDMEVQRAPLLKLMPKTLLTSPEKFREEIEDALRQGRGGS